MNRTSFRFGQGERDAEPLGVAWCVIIALAISSSTATAEEKFQKLTGPQIRAKIAGMEVSDEVGGISMTAAVRCRACR